MRNIYRIGRYITFESCHHLVRSLILSRLDYANSLLFSISAKDRKKLETLQNKAARIIIFRCDRLEQSAPLLRKLHWLPVKERVIYKVMLLTYKSVNKLAPAYLAELLKAYKPSQDMRTCVPQKKRCLSPIKTLFIADKQCFSIKKHCFSLEKHSLLRKTKFIE